MSAGYAVDPDAVAAGGRTACDLADDLRAARSTWDGATRDGGSACGMDLVQEAYTTMQDAWFDEVGVHITVLEQLCEALRAAAGGYQSMERSGSTSLGGQRVE